MKNNNDNSKADTPLVRAYLSLPKAERCRFVLAITKHGEIFKWLRDAVGLSQGSFRPRAFEKFYSELELKFDTILTSNGHGIYSLAYLVFLFLAKHRRTWIHDNANLKFENETCMQEMAARIASSPLAEKNADDPWWGVFIAWLGDDETKICLKAFKSFNDAEVGQEGQEKEVEEEQEQIQELEATVSHAGEVAENGIEAPDTDDPAVCGGSEKDKIVEEGGYDWDEISRLASRAEDIIKLAGAAKEFDLKDACSLLAQLADKGEGIRGKIRGMADSLKKPMPDWVSIDELKEFADNLDKEKIEACGRDSDRKFLGQVAKFMEKIKDLRIRNKCSREELMSYKMRAIGELRSSASGESPAKLSGAASDGDDWIKKAYELVDEPLECLVEELKKDSLSSLAYFIEKTNWDQLIFEESAPTPPQY